MTSLHTLLVLGRVSNLPTVWSNCLAGWLLGGGGPWGRFALLCGGATSLYLGGMFLNDAFDAAWDRQHRRERPIPSGAISERAVWMWGCGLLIGGVVLLLPLGRNAAVLALLLAATIVLYDAIHKAVAFAPLLMAECRFLLYLVAAAAAKNGVTGLTLWSALALGLYVAGLSWKARSEHDGHRVRRWPALLLPAPIALALLVNTAPHLQAAVCLSSVLGLWILRSLWRCWGAKPPDIGATVAGLLAGIVWVDWLAVADQAREFSLIFIGLFLLAWLSQRLSPAT